MNTNSNIYTIVYSAIIVVLVSAILAFASSSLKPMQEANKKAETIRQMLTAAQFATKEELGDISNDNILKQYSEKVEAAFLIDKNGNKTKDLNLGKEKLNDIDIFDGLKAENKGILNTLRGDNNAKFEIPVYIFNKDGEKITVIPIYGAGLWGPVWGYIALKDDLKTIVGTFFDHESETPGLGAKITDDPAFRAQFISKSLDLSDNTEHIFEIKKGGAPKDQSNAIDAITGATLTSQGLDAAINTWTSAYRTYLSKNASKDEPHNENSESNNVEE